MRKLRTTVALLLLLACEGGDASGSRSMGGVGGEAARGGSSGGGVGESGGISGQASGGAAPAGAAGALAGAAGAGPQGPTCPPPVDLGVRMVGRHDGCDPTGVRFRWSGTGFVARFSGTGVTVRLVDGSNQFTVLVDGLLRDKLVTTAGTTDYVIATGLAEGSHTLELYRRTEASFGPTLLLGIEVEGGALEPPPEAPPRRMEVIGDSISCGYGIEGDGPSCPFSADTENHYLTYGAILARSFGAELSTVAWSGKGVVHNYGGDMKFPMPRLYDVAVDSQADWDFSLFQPHVVIVNLGTNDFSTSADPTDEEFIATYSAFLAHLRDVYAGAIIFCTVGPMLTGAALTQARADIAAAVAERNASGDHSVRVVEIATENLEPGCDYHPNPAVHAGVAAELEPAIAAVLGW